MVLTAVAHPLRTSAAMSEVVAAVAEVVAPVVLAFRHERLQVVALHHSAFLAVEVVPVSTSLLEKTGTMQKYFLVLPCWLGQPPAVSWLSAVCLM